MIQLSCMFVHKSHALYSSMFEKENIFDVNANFACAGFLNWLLEVASEWSLWLSWIERTDLEAKTCSYGTSRLHMFILWYIADDRDWKGSGRWPWQYDVLMESQPLSMVISLPRMGWSSSRLITATLKMKFTIHRLVRTLDRPQIRAALHCTLRHQRYSRKSWHHFPLTIQCYTSIPPKASSALGSQFFQFQVSMSLLFQEANSGMDNHLLIPAKFWFQAGNSMPSTFKSRHLFQIYHCASLQPDIRDCYLWCKLLIQLQSSAP